MTALDPAQSPITRTVPTPAPRPEAPAQSGADAQPAAAPAKSSTDQTSFSQESQEASAAQSSPVNFAAWGPAEAGNAGSNAVEGAADVSALGTGNLRKGSSGEQVEALQRMLNEKTGGNLEVDGKFGKNTLAALKKYQESQGLEADGIAGKDTRAAFAGQGGGDTAKPTDAVAPAGETSAGAPAPDAVAPDAAAPTAAANEAGPDGAVPPAEEPKANTDEPKADADELKADAEQAKTGSDASEAKGTEAAGDAAKTSAVPGTEDTSWTEKLPKGLKPHAQAFIDAGKKHGVDPRFLASISMHESDKGTSYSMRKRNNAMGIMKGSKHRTFDSVADSINAQAKSLTRDGGYYVGKHSISSIGNTYAPVGADNDPGNLNRHWIPSITKNYKALGGDSSARVKGFETNT